MLHLKAGFVTAMRLRTLTCRNCSLLQNARMGQKPLQGFHTNAVRNFAFSAKTFNDAQQTVTVSSTNVLPVATDTSSIVDPPFVDMGLGTGLWPYHWIQTGLEWFYITTGCPWWLTILAGTCIVRTIMLPVYVQTRKQIIHLQNKMPEQQKYLEKLQEAKVSGSYNKQMHATKRLQTYMKESKTGPIRNLMVNLPMPFLFMSMMMALRQITAVPVPSLEATQFLWLESLSSPDPYYLLPLITGSLLGISLHIQFKSGMVNIPSANLQKFAFVIPYIPVIALPLFLGRSASGVTLYILINTVFTLGSVWLLANPNVKKWLNFPVLEKNDLTGTSITQSFKDLMKSTREKAQRKQEIHNIKKMKKQSIKDRKKALKKAPPVTYAIGSEAVYKRKVPDFVAMWNNKPPNIYNQQNK